MKQLLALLVVVLVAGCAHAPPYRNERPMTPFPLAAELIPKCEITVRFNEDEASVPETDYLDSMFCLGLMEGILGTNFALPDDQKLFCPPAPGIKTWIAAKSVVDFAHENSAMLLELSEADFSIIALTSKYPCNEG